MKRGGPLRRRTPLRARSVLKRSGRLPARSSKTAEGAAERRAFVEEVLRRQPVCAWPGCRRESVDVHEPLTRARGGSILDPTNSVGVCRTHHDRIHDHPDEATELGLLRHSWDRDR